MSCLLAKRAVVAYIALSLVVLALPGLLAAQGRGPESLQPDPSAVFITVVSQHNAPVARGNILILPSPSQRTTTGQASNAASTANKIGTIGTNTVTVSGSPYGVGTTITPTTTQPEAEEEIAVDPSDTTGNNLVSAISDFSNGFNFTKWTLSTNGGSSWTENFAPYDPNTGLLLTSDGQSWDANSDPVLAFDQSGNVYLSDIYINVDSQGRFTGEGLYVSVDTFSNLQVGNFAHTYPVRVNLNNGKSFSIEDKPWIAVDKNPTSDTADSHQGTVYASWSHFTGCQNKFSPFIGYYLTCSSDVAYLAYSIDHGQTWSNPIKLNPKTQNGAVQGSQVAVGPDGKVYVAYEFFGSGNQRRQYLSVGTWNGSTLSFSSPFPATPLFNELTFSGCSTCSASYRVNSFPNIAVGPATAGNQSGNVYIEYGGQANSTSTAQVYIVACTSSCNTSNRYGSPILVNDTSAGNHFFPAIAVDNSGVIHTSWFDGRNNPSNPDYMDIYAAYLTYDSGTNSFTLSPNARVTPSTMDASELDGFGDTDFIGDYAGIAATAATPATAHPVWTNASGLLGLIGAGSLQTTALTLP